MAVTSEAIERALGYPYAIPERSFALVGGGAIDLEAVEVDLTARRPVLAYGSNAAPAVLARKLAATADPVPVVRADLSGFDVVYSAHISAYGAVPAQLAPSPGTEVSAFVAHLTEEQLRLLSKTEPNYRLSRLRDDVCRLEDATSPAAVSAYLSRHGCLLRESTEIAVAGIVARGRRFPAMSQPEVLELVRSLVCPERSLEDFITAVAAEPELARRWTQTLAKRRSASRASTP